MSPGDCQPGKIPRMASLMAWPAVSLQRVLVMRNCVGEEGFFFFFFLIHERGFALEQDAWYHEIFGLFC